MINEFSITQSPPSPPVVDPTWNKIPGGIHTFGIFSRVQPFFSDPLEKEGRGDSVCKSPHVKMRAVVFWRRTQTKTMHTITLVWWCKEFPPSLRLIVALPFTLLLHLHLPPRPRYSTPRRFSGPPEEDRHVKKKVRILFPGMLLLQAPFLLSLLLLLLLSRITGVSKLQGEVRRGEEKEGDLDSLRRGRITRGQDGRRLVRILFPKCG